MNLIKRVAVFGGPVAGVLLFALLTGVGLDFPSAITAAITAWVALWWVFEPIPIPATSLIPFAAFPLAGVLSNKQVAGAYGHWLIILLLGGFILSTAMESSGVHRRLALSMVRLVGGNQPRRLLLGFMLATALCSWWISNTATTLMMLPIVLAVIQHESATIRVPLLLGIAYSASIGGIATPIGTPPNVVLMGVYNELTGLELGFMEWMQFGVPVSLVLLATAWVYLARQMPSEVEEMKPIEELGPLSTYEFRVLVVFAITAIAWMTRSQPFGGWSGALGLTGIGDDTVALAAVIALFVIPNGDAEGSRLLDWEQANKIPWGLLILFGGGIAIAKAFMASGLSELIGEALSTVVAWPLFLLIGALCLAVTFLTEITSNTATTTLLMPILAAAATAAGLDPLTMMVPAAISASCAFMLPVATAPNAIVFGTGDVTVSQMARHGVVLNLLGVGIITSLFYCFWI